MVRLSGWRVFLVRGVVAVGAMALQACTISLDMMGDAEENETTVASEASSTEPAQHQSQQSVRLIRSTKAAEPKPEQAVKPTSRPAPTPVPAATRDSTVQVTGYDALAAPIKKVTTGPIRSAADVDKAVAQLKEWEPASLTEGLVVHKAVAALTSERFAEAVRVRAQEEGPDIMLERLENDPSAVREIDGSREGLAAIAKSLQADADALKAIATKFTALWEELAPAGAVPPESAIADSAATLPFGDSTQAAASFNNRILVLAARRALGRDLTLAGPAAEPLTQCLRFARLNLNQCLVQDSSPAHNAYCAGRHGADEVASCIDWATLGGSS
jgi:hypothetical protein